MNWKCIALLHRVCDPGFPLILSHGDNIQRPFSSHEAFWHSFPRLLWNFLFIHLIKETHFYWIVVVRQLCASMAVLLLLLLLSAGLPRNFIWRRREGGSLLLLDLASVSFFSFQLIMNDGVSRASHAPSIPQLLFTYRQLWHSFTLLSHNITSLVRYIFLLFSIIDCVYNFLPGYSRGNQVKFSSALAKFPELSNNNIIITSGVIIPSKDEKINTLARSSTSRNNNNKNVQLRDKSSSRLSCIVSSRSTN